MALNVTYVGVGRRNTLFLCMCSRNYFFIVLITNIVIVVVVMFRNHQVMVTSLGYCWYSRGAPRVLIVEVPAMSGRRWVRGRWRMIEVLLLDMNVRLTCEI